MALFRPTLPTLEAVGSTTNEAFVKWIHKIFAAKKGKVQNRLSFRAFAVEECEGVTIKVYKISKTTRFTLS